MAIQRIESVRERSTSLVTLLLAAILAVVSASSVVREDSVPTFSLTDLQRLSSNKNGSFNLEDRSDDFRKALSTNGLLAIHLDDHDDEMIHGYSIHRKTAMDGLCSCVDHPNFLELDQTHRLTLQKSSTERTSVATATVGLDHPLPLPKGMESACGTAVVDAMEGLRDVVASVSRAFVSALDQNVVMAETTRAAASSSSPATLLRDEFGRSYESVADIVKSANHLEHFHVYTNQNDDTTSSALNNNSQQGKNMAWDWHTDAGLFLVFVPAWDCNGNIDEHENVDDSFYYRDTNGDTVRAKFQGSNTAIVMLGQGAQDWLDIPSQNHSPSQQQQTLLRATTHSVRWSDRQPMLGTANQLSHQTIPQQRRSWYGMMNLVPESALIYGGKTLREVKQSLSMAHQHKANYQPSLEFSENNENMSLGCGSVAAPKHGVGGNDERNDLELEPATTTSRRRRHLEMQDASMCNNVTNFFCWMTCMDIPKIQEAPLFLEAGYSLYCLDKATLKSTGKLAVAHEACVDVHNMGCVGEWEKTVLGVPSIEINITALESSVELEYPFCYSGTTMYMEGFQWVQSSTCVILLFPSWVLNSAWKYALATIGTIFLAIGLEKFIQQRRKAMARMEEGMSRLFASAVFYAVQLSMGYILMLIIMIYSGVLFLAVILGLVIGHILFNARDAIWPIHESQHLNNGEEDDDTSEEDENSSGKNASKSTTESAGIETTAIPKRSSCCSTLTTSNLVEEAELEGEERALTEGATHCQGFDTDYGSLESGSAHGKSPVTSKKTKGKRIDQSISEGSTPCCQHGN